jgi:twitching motility protein PilT
MRDLETIQLTITAAETGHLTFATLHTQDAPSTVDRIIDVFPPHQQTQVRVQLAAPLQGVVSQILLPRKDGKGRVAAREIMVMTPAIQNLIREGKTHMIYSAIETGAKFGMISMDKALAGLVLQGHVAYDVAIAKAHDQGTFKTLCNKVD